MLQDLVRIPVAINTRRYGPMDKVACALLFFFARRATRSGEESGFPEFGAT